jgi:hypothetical protein
MHEHRWIFAIVLSGSMILEAIAIGVACSRATSGSTALGGLAQLEQDTGVEWVAVQDAHFGTTHERGVTAWYRHHPRWGGGDEQAN